MEIRHGTLNNCSEAKDIAVVIDVLRAFTTAAFAFDNGAKSIDCVAELSLAMQLKATHPDWIVMGEVDGLSVPGFDLNNSPARIIQRDLQGKKLIHRTTAGTQGLIRAANARVLLACSLVNAAATAEAIRKINPREVFFVETGVTPEGHGDEDTACADYIEGLLTGKPIPEAEIVDRVQTSLAAEKFLKNNHPDLLAEDVEIACDLNRFDWLMVGKRIDNSIVQLRKVCEL